MSVIPDETVKVSVAAVDAPGARVEVVGLHVRVIYVLAFEGVQFDGVMPRVSETPVPVFLMYTVLTTDPPGVGLPQLIDVNGVVQLISE
jgi:hypothetical protein